MDHIILFRIAERLTLTAVVLLVALVVMVGFWRTVQKIDIADGSKLGLGGSFVLSTPVFVLLAIIGYSWVSLEHPIAVGPAAKDGEKLAGLEHNASSFTGIVTTQAANSSEGYDAAKSQRQLRSLNCLTQNQPLSNRADVDITDIKLTLMGNIWQSDWGEWSDFADWAQGRNMVEPVEGARSAWLDQHPLC